MVDLHKSLQDQYYDHLESQGIDYLELDDLGEGYTTLYVKPIYADKTDAEMALELGYKDFEDWRKHGRG